MPNIRISKETLRQLREAKAVFTLATGEDYSLDTVIRMLIGDALNRLLLTKPEQLRAHADMLDRLAKEKARMAEAKATSSRASS